jgi:hypothetical protein
VTVRSGDGTAGLPPSSGYWVAFFPHNGTTTMGVARWSGGGGSVNISGDLPGSGAWTPGVARRVRFRAVGNDLKLKMWTPGGAEPGWFWEGSDATLAGVTGQLHIATLSGAGTDAKHMLIDNLTISDGA